MPEPFPWTAEIDAGVVAARARKETWDIIAARIGVSRWCVIDHARKAGLVAHNVRAVVVERDAGEVAEDERERWALPAGHPISWGAISKGTEYANI